jgi:dGTPase
MEALFTTTDRESALLAPYAMHSADSRGRHYDEPPHDYRGPYQRDRDRITHCAAFRRLSRKTQVVTGDENDYHRTRLTHTLEVASIARTMARSLRLNEDLVEALALAHDIGHPPFGHAGEEVLDELLAGDGGFDHNRQALRIFERLEWRYPEFPGLNLTREVLDGQRYRGNKSSAAEWQPLLEVQVVDAADSIAYDAHDADDALELGLLELGDLNQCRLWRDAEARVRGRFTAIDSLSLRRAVVHELIDTAVSATLDATRRQLELHAPPDADEARRLGWLVTMPSDLAEARRELETFLFERLYRHPQIVRRRKAVGESLAACFARLVAHPEGLPVALEGVVASDGVRRAVGDHLASLTDRGLLDLAQGRLF